MSEKSGPLTIAEFATFMEQHAKSLNEAFGYIFKRFDDIEQRLDILEQRLGTVEKSVSDVRTDVHTVKNDTRLIHPMFELVRTDGAEVGELRVRVERLEKRPS